MVLPLKYEPSCANTASPSLSLSLSQPPFQSLHPEALLVVLLLAEPLKASRILSIQSIETLFLFHLVVAPSPSLRVSLYIPVVLERYQSSPHVLKTLIKAARMY